MKKTSLQVHETAMDSQTITSQAQPVCPHLVFSPGDGQTQRAGTPLG